MLTDFTAASVDIFTFLSEQIFSNLKIVTIDFVVIARQFKTKQIHNLPLGLPLSKAVDNGGDKNCHFLELHPYQKYSIS